MSEKHGYQPASAPSKPKPPRGGSGTLPRKDRSGEPIYCDCCGTEHLATKKDGKIIITDRRHGKRHWAVVVLDI